MRQFEKKNPPKFENGLKCPTFRATVKAKISYRKGCATRPKSLVYETALVDYYIDI